ncbi:hypothetical protein ILUMI_09478 [Ignelater luminosus]|uniref:DDE Tnp4 domain-containing protein n=1 Tax=Ignelater luminosus TaxID=2038154 RepID=A0A8K0GCD9_IGNLU|nr:hypothetical protein ILUMI_09478 [Ignelater luminosus]
MAAIAVNVALLGVIVKRRIDGCRKRKVWTKNWLQRRPNNNVLHMLSKELLEEDPMSYRNFLRLTNSQFLYILSLVTKDIAKQETFMRDSISAQNRLEVTLRFLAAGKSFRSLMYSTRIHESTISRFVPEVCDAIYSSLKTQFLRTPTTEEEWKIIADEFETLWQFPHCLGALDGKHISFRAPISEGSYYFNYKGYNTIVLLAMCDARYKFTYINVGANERVSDAGIFQQSSLCRAMQAVHNPLNLPKPQPLPGQNSVVPYVIIGDDAFPLGKHLLKSYPQRSMSDSSKIFNYRLSRARRMIETSFGILANRFRIFLAPINLPVEKVEIITLACVALHNYLATCNGNKYTDILPEEDHNLTHIGKQGENHSSQDARTIRDQFRLYFNTHCAVEWQDKAVAECNL